MIATSIQVATVQVLHCVRAIRYQAKSEQNVRQRHGEAALCHPTRPNTLRFKIRGVSSNVVNDDSVTCGYMPPKAIKYF